MPSLESGATESRCDRPADAATVVAISQQIQALFGQHISTAAARMRELSSQLDLIADDAAPEALAATLLNIAFWHFHATTEPRAGMIPVERAVVVASLANNQDLLRKALMFKGLICADTGDCGMAIECYTQALDIAERIQDHQAEAAVWTNLGAALTYSATYHDAIRCFERALEIAEGLTDAPIRASRQASLTNIAICYLHLEEFHRGVEILERAVADSPEPSSPSEALPRVLLEYTFTRVLLMVGDIEGARSRAALAKKYSQLANMPRAAVAAENAEGLVEVFMGNTDVGVSRLTFSLERAKTLKAAYRDTLIALVMAHERANRPDTASAYQKQLMVLTSKTLEENALFHNALHLKRLDRRFDHAGAINLVLDRRYEILKRKAVEHTRLAERTEMLERLAVTAELRDDSTGEHSYRVGRLASILANEFGLDEATCHMIDHAGRLHDIGKIGIPDGILLKPGRLSTSERHLMETHTVIGAELLAKSDMPELQMAEQIARHHHEHWVGTGYPFRMGNEHIPIAARITALADVFDALTHVRPYKLAWTVEDALAEIGRLRGQQFDPVLTDLFIPLIWRLMKEHEGDLDRFLGQGARSSTYLQSREKISFALHRPLGRTEANS